MSCEMSVLELQLHLQSFIQVAINLLVLVIRKIQRLQCMFPFFDGWILFARLDEQRIAFLDAQVSLAAEIVESHPTVP